MDTQRFSIKAAGHSEAINYRKMQTRQFLTLKKMITTVSTGAHSSTRTTFRLGSYSLSGFARVVFEEA